MSGETMVAEDEARLLREGGHDVHMWAPVPEAEGVLGLAVQMVKRLVREHRADIVHAHNLFTALSPAVLRAAAAEGAAVVMTLHSYRLLCLPGSLLRDGKVCELCLGRLPWRGVRYRCYRDSMPASAALATSLSVHRAIRTFNRVTRFFAVSRFVRDKYVQAGFPSGQIAVKPNFSWPSPRRSGPGEYFLVLGRLHPEKGVGTVVEAWRDHGAPGRVLVAGDGTEAASLRKTAPSTVEFLGEVPPPQVPDLVARARALLVPSLWYEAAPRGIVEAYAVGVPVVASRIGALPEAVEEGVSGLLAAPGDAASWAAAAARLADDSESERLGDGAHRMWRERFSPERGLQDLEAAYREAMSSAG
jgi:glycosyltransferase involved in cell wall biosynthesis